MQGVYHIMPANKYDPYFVPEFQYHCTHPSNLEIVVTIRGQHNYQSLVSVIGVEMGDNFPRAIVIEHCYNKLIIKSEIFLPSTYNTLVVNTIPITLIRIVTI